jgi:hypothetical protein
MLRLAKSFNQNHSNILMAERFVQTPSKLGFRPWREILLGRLTLPPLEAVGFLLHRELPAVAGLTFAPQAFYVSACPAATSILTPSSLTFLAAL